MASDVSSTGQRRFEVIYEAHGPAVLSYCARRIDGSDPADACAETFLVAWRRIDDVPEAPSTLPYLYGVARLVVANQRRGARRRSRLDAMLVALGVAPPVDPAVVSAAQTVDDLRVAAAVRALPGLDREIVMLWAWEDLSRHEIATIVGMSAAAVDQRIHRAYGRLARSLGPALAETADPR